MKTRQTPYKCHLFVCTKSRNGERKSCGDADSAALKNALKDAVKDRGWKGVVRISDSGCLGLCEAGPNIMIYPQKIWLAGVKPTDIPEIMQTMEDLLKD